MLYSDINFKKYSWQCFDCLFYTPFLAYYCITLVNLLCISALLHNYGDRPENLIWVAGLQRNLFALEILGLASFALTQLLLNADQMYCIGLNGYFQLSLSYHLSLRPLFCLF